MNIMGARVVVTTRGEGKQGFMIQRVLTWVAIIPVLVLQQFIRFCTYVLYTRFVFLSYFIPHSPI